MSDSFQKALYTCAFILLIMSTAQAALPTTTNLVRYYGLDDNVTSMVILDKLGNNGVLYGGNSNDKDAKGIVNGSIDLDGNGDYVDSGFRPDPREGISFNIWVKFNAFAGNKHIVSAWGSGGAGNAAFLINTDFSDNSKVAFQTFDGTSVYSNTTATNALSTTRWVMLTLVFDGTSGDGRLYGYVNGTLAVQRAAKIQHSTNYNMFIGKEATNTGKEPNTKIDEFSLWNRSLTASEIASLYNSGAGVSYSDLSSGGAPATNDSLTIIHPTAGSDILNYSHYISFNMSVNASYVNVNVSVDGVFNQTLLDVPNATTYILWLNLSEGSHTINISNAYTSTISDSVTFDVHYSEALIKKMTFSSLSSAWIYSGDVLSSSYETKYLSSDLESVTGDPPIAHNYGYHLVIRYARDLGISSNVTLHVNGTSYDRTLSRCGYVGTGSLPPASPDRFCGAALNFYLPFLEVNNTNITFTTNLNYTLGGAILKAAQVNVTLPVYFAMVPKHLTKDKNEMLESDTVSTTGYVKNISANNITLSSKLYINDAYWSTVSGVRDSVGNYSTTATYTSPKLSNLNVSYNVTQQINMSYGGASRLVNVSAPDIIIYQINITRCASGFAFAISSRDQATTALLTNSSFDVLIEAGRVVTGLRNFSFNYSANTSISNVTFCLKPGNLSVTVDASAQVNHINYYQGSLAVVGRRLNETTPSRYSVYLISTATGLPTVLEALGNNDDPLVGYTVYVQRYFYPIGAYVSIFSAKTDSFGRVVPYLDWYDTYYVMIVAYPNGTVAKTFEPMIITDDPVKLRVVGVDEGFANIYSDIQHNCTWTNATGILRCTVLDSAGVVNLARLEVYQNVLFAYTKLCDTYATGSAVTLTCNLSAAGTSSFTYVLSVDMTGFSPHTLETGTVFEALTMAYGNSGAFAGLLLTTALGMVGLGIAGGMGAVAFSVMGLIISAIIGIFPLGTDATVLVGIILITFIIMLVGRRD